MMMEQRTRVVLPSQAALERESDEYITDRSLQNGAAKDTRFMKFQTCYKASVDDNAQEDFASVLLCQDVLLDDQDKVVSVNRCVQHNISLTACINVYGHVEHQVRYKKECQSSQDYCTHCPLSVEANLTDVELGPKFPDPCNSNQQTTCFLPRTNVILREHYDDTHDDTYDDTHDDIKLVCDEKRGSIRIFDDGYASDFYGFMESCDEEYYHNDIHMPYNFGKDFREVQCEPFDDDGSCPGYCHLLESQSFSSKELDEEVPFQDTRFWKYQSCHQVSDTTTTGTGGTAQEPDGDTSPFPTSDYASVLICKHREQDSNGKLVSMNDCVQHNMSLFDFVNLHARYARQIQARNAECRHGDYCSVCPIETEAMIDVQHLSLEEWDRPFCNFRKGCVPPFARYFDGYRFGVNKSGEIRCIDGQIHALQPTQDAGSFKDFHLNTSQMDFELFNWYYNGTSRFGTPYYDGYTQFRLPFSDEDPEMACNAFFKFEDSYFGCHRLCQLWETEATVSRVLQGPVYFSETAHASPAATMPPARVPGTVSSSAVMTGESQRSMFHPSGIIFVMVVVGIIVTMSIAKGRKRRMILSVVNGQEGATPYGSFALDHEVDIERRLWEFGGNLPRQQATDPKLVCEYQMVETNDKSSTM